MIPDGFEDPWEQLRLLADESRTAALVELLRRRASGARVLEIGAGSGLLSCAAARLGAAHVYAVEASDLIDAARQLVAASGLEQVVEVLPGDICELAPRPVDLAFGELLNADPFAEGLIESMAAAASWLEPHGWLAPHRVKLRVALVADDGSAKEVESAGAQINRLCHELDLPLEPLRAALAPKHPFSYLAPQIEPLSPAVALLELDLAAGEELPDQLSFSITPQSQGRAGGAVIWFEAALDHGLILSNPPRTPGHFGVLVSGWPESIELIPGQQVELRATFEEEHIEVMPR